MYKNPTSLAPWLGYLRGNQGPHPGPLRANFNQPIIRNTSGPTQYSNKILCSTNFQSNWSFLLLYYSVLSNKSVLWHCNQVNIRKVTLNTYLKLDSSDSINIHRCTSLRLSKVAIKVCVFFLILLMYNAIYNTSFSFQTMFVWLGFMNIMLRSFSTYSNYCIYFRWNIVYALGRRS